MGFFFGGWGINQVLKFLWVLETTKELVNDDYSNNQYMIEDSNSRISLSHKKNKKK